MICRAWACWSVAMNSQKGQGMWATGIRLWCWWFWFAIQKPRQRLPRRRLGGPFFPLAIHSHAQSISPASCRSKRVDDHSRFYANFRDFRGARVSTLESMTIRTNFEIWSPKKKLNSYISIAKGPHNPADRISPEPISDEVQKLQCGELPEAVWQGAEPIELEFQYL